MIGYSIDFWTTQFKSSKTPFTVTESFFFSRGAATLGQKMFNPPTTGQKYLRSCVVVVGVVGTIVLKKLSNVVVVVVGTIVLKKLSDPFCSVPISMIAQFFGSYLKFGFYLRPK